MSVSGREELRRDRPVDPAMDSADDLRDPAAAGDREISAQSLIPTQRNRETEPFTLSLLANRGAITLEELELLRTFFQFKLITNHTASLRKGAACLIKGVVSSILR